MAQKNELDSLPIERRTVGFYNYPMSQVADILLPRAHLVPVGEDQAPHIEMTREIARKFKLSPLYVGKICRQNKIVLAIPCHRVIRSNGSMGGFSSVGGVSLKKKILNFEHSWK